MRDAVLVIAGGFLVVVAVLTGSVQGVVLGAAFVGMPVALAAPPDRRTGPRGKDTCICRGCRRPGQRYLWERLLRKPLSAVPRTHAEAQLGIEHGRLHDLRRMEAEAGVSHSAEVIQHFALREDEWIETEYDGWGGDWRNGGCSAVPEMIATVWG